MCPSTRVWCRALVGALLVTLGASLEPNEAPPAFEDLLYQDGNDIDTGPEQARALPRRSDVMLRRIVQALQLQGADDMNSYRYRKLPYEANGIYSEWLLPEGERQRELAYLRQGSWGGHPLAKKSNEPQQKWKTKKGRPIGSNMVCYFKLCAFTSPA